MINLYERTDGGGDYGQAAYPGGSVGLPSAGDSGLDFMNLLQSNVPQVSSFFRRGGERSRLLTLFEWKWIDFAPFVTIRQLSNR